jgi:hypothetical protein
LKASHQSLGGSSVTPKEFSRAGFIFSPHIAHLYPENCPPPLHSNAIIGDCSQTTHTQEDCSLLSQWLQTISCLTKPANFFAV